MTKQDLVKTIASRADVKKADVELVFAAQAAVAAEELQREGGEIPLFGIGKLKAATLAGRTGRNPATGEALDIPPRNTAKLVLSADFKRALI